MTIDTATLGGISLKTWADEPVTLGSAWAQRPVVLVWLRHFG